MFNRFVLFDKMKQFIILFSLILASFNLSAQQSADENKSRTNETEKELKNGYYQSGALRYRGYFQNGHPAGEVRYFFESGELKAINNFSPDGKRAYNKTYSTNAILVAEGLYIEQQKDSLWRIYSDIDGALVAEETYKLNRLHGESRFYNPKSGNMSELITYKNGKKHGVWKRWYDNGRLLNEATYENGQLQGAAVFYHPNGLVQFKGEYQNDVKVGFWQSFDEEGQQISKDEYIPE